MQKGKISLLVHFIHIILITWLVSPCALPQDKKSDKHSNISQSSESSQIIVQVSRPKMFEQELMPAIKVLQKLIKKITRNNKTKISDAEYIKYQDLFTSAIEKVDDKMEKDAIFQEWAHKADEKSIDDVLGGTGFRIVGCLGPSHIIIDSKTMLNLFRPYLSDATVEYLTILAREEAEQGKWVLICDDGVSISLHELAERIVSRELFLSRYPKFPNSGQFEFFCKWYLEIYLGTCQMDNFSTFSYDTLDYEVKQSYLTLIREHPMTKCAVVVRGYLDVLKQNNDKYTYETDKYLFTQGLIDEKQLKEAKEYHNRKVARQENTTNKYEAWAMMKQFIDGYLLSPSTASYGHLSEIGFEQRGNLWVFDGFVDCQNAFGVMMRKSYTIGMKFEPSTGEWSLYQLVWH